MSKSLLNGRFQLLRPATKGSRAGAEFFEARDAEGAAGECLVKVVREEFRGHPGVAAAFVREKEVLARLRGTACAPELVDGGPVVSADGKAEKGRSFLAVAAIRDEHAKAAGRDLEELLKGTRASWGDEAAHALETVRYAKLLCDAVRELHVRKVAHRALCPTAVWVGRTAERKRFVKLFDFGVAVAYDGAATRTLPFDAGRAERARFLAPETAVAAEPRPFDEEKKGDVYALGALIYWIATEASPYEDAFYDDLAKGRLPGPARVVPPAERKFVGKKLPEELAGAIVAAVSVDPAHRPSLEELSAEIEAWAKGFAREKAGKAGAETPRGDAIADGAPERTMPTPKVAAEPATDAPPPETAAASQTSARTAGGSGSTARSTATDSPASRYSPLKYPPGLMLAGRYEIEKMLGRGSFAVVYLAVDKKVGGKVAIKIPFEDQEVEDLLKEARRTRQIRSRNVVTIHDLLDEHDPPLIVMDYIDGRGLDEIVKEGGPANDARFRELAFGLAHGLKDAHEQKIVHRDLSPKNILVEKSGQPFITDFGLAKVLDAANKVSEKSRRIGHNYFAFVPEEADADFRLQTVPKDVGPHSDVYQIGAIYYYIATAKEPFRLEPIGAWADALNKIPDPIGNLNPIFAGTHVERLVARCLEKDWRRRPKNGGDLEKELQEAVNADIIDAAVGKKSAAPLPTPSVIELEDGASAFGAKTAANAGGASAGAGPAKPNRKPLVFAGLAAVVLAAGAYLAGGGGGEPQPPARPEAPTSRETGTNPGDGPASAPVLVDDERPAREFFRLADPTKHLARFDGDDLFVARGRPLLFDATSPEGRRAEIVGTDPERPAAELAWTSEDNGYARLATETLEPGRYALSVSAPRNGKLAKSAVALTVLERPADPAFSAASAQAPLFLASELAPGLVAPPGAADGFVVRQDAPVDAARPGFAPFANDAAAWAALGAPVGGRDDAVAAWTLKTANRAGEPSAGELRVFVLPAAATWTYRTAAGSAAPLAAALRLRPAEGASVGPAAAYLEALRRAGLKADVALTRVGDAERTGGGAGERAAGAPLTDGVWRAALSVSAAGADGKALGAPRTFDAPATFVVDETPPTWFFGFEGAEKPLASDLETLVVPVGSGAPVLRLAQDGTSTAHAPPLSDLLGRDKPALASVSLDAVEDAAGNRTPRKRLWIVNRAAAAFEPEAIAKAVFPGAASGSAEAPGLWIDGAARARVEGVVGHFAGGDRRAGDLVATVRTAADDPAAARPVDGTTSFAEGPVALTVEVAAEGGAPLFAERIAVRVDKTPPVVASWTASPSGRRGDGAAEIVVEENDEVVVVWRDDASGLDAATRAAAPVKGGEARAKDLAGNEAVAIVRRESKPVPAPTPTPVPTPSPTPAPPPPVTSFYDGTLRAILEDFSRGRGTPFTESTAFVGGAGGPQFAVCELSTAGLREVAAALGDSDVSRSFGALIRADNALDKTHPGEIVLGSNSISADTAAQALRAFNDRLRAVSGNRLRLPTADEWKRVVIVEGRTYPQASRWDETQSVQRRNRPSLRSLASRGGLFGTWGSVWEVVQNGSEFHLIGGGYGNAFDSDTLRPFEPLAPSRFGTQGAFAGVRLVREP